MNMPLIEFKNLTIGYEHKSIIKNINLEINEGDYVCIFGDNGVGKSTFLKTLLSLLSPLDGNIIFDESLNKKMIGYLPQKMEVKSEFPASCLEVVLSGTVNRLGFRPFYGKKEKELAKKNMDLLGVTPLSQKPFRELSGGQQQRVLLARALCAMDKVLVLDEPFTGLDASTTAKLHEVLDKLNKEKKVTIIVVSHFMEDIVSHASKVVHLDKEEVFCGSPKEYEEKFNFNLLKLHPIKPIEEDE